MNRDKLTRLIFCALCLFSGASGLIYETLWIRVLSLGVGSTSASLGLVLSIFFLGLAAGSYVAGKKPPRIARPWYAYGILEAAIGLYGLVVLWPLFHFSSILGVFSSPGLFTKGLIVALLLAPPTICMGATLPLLVRAAHGIFQKPERAVSLLYGLNTLGAVIGAALTSFVLIPSMGIWGSNVFSVALNLLVFAVVWALRSRVPAMAPESEAKPQPVDELVQRPAWLPGLRAGILAVSALCGLGAIAVEVIWSKYLSIFFGTNIYGLGLVLSLYLLGMALGSLFISIWINRIERPLRLLALLILAAMVALVLACRALNLAPVATSVLSFYSNGHLGPLAIKGIVAFSILFVPTCLFGMIFPLCVRVLRGSGGQGVQSEASLLGMAYSLNTVGSILGSAVTGLWLIPNMGSSAAVYLAVGAFGLPLLALVLQGATTGPERYLKRLLHGGLAAGAVLGCVLLGEVHFRNIISSAYFQTPPEGMDLPQVISYFSRTGEVFKFVHEGKSGVISLGHDPQDGDDYKRYLRLKTNGLNESVYDTRDLQSLPKYEALLGFLPYTLVRGPENAFLVGYGGGFTVDFLTSTSLREVHVAELEEGILKAADVAYGGNNPITKRPNLKLEIEDARYILASRPKARYDMILSQPSHSWLSGVANLFTRDFFEIVKGRLSDKGVFSQWLNLYNMDPTVLKSIMRTFYEVFPHGAIFTQEGDQEMIMIGSLRPIDLGVQKLMALARNQKFRRQLVHVPLDDGYDLLANFALGREDALRLSEGAPINTDQNAYAEVAQGRLFYRPSSVQEGPQAFLARAYTGDLSSVVRPEDLAVGEFYERLLKSLATKRQRSRMLTVLSRYERLVGGIEARDPQVLTRLGHWCLQVQRYASATEYAQKALRLQASNLVLQVLMGSYVARSDYNSVLALASERPRSRNPVIECHIAHAALEVRGVRAALPYFRPLVSDAATYESACGTYFQKVLGRYYLALGDNAAARAWLEAYYKASPDDREVVADLTSTYLGMRDWDNAKAFTGYVPQVLELHDRRKARLDQEFRQRGLVKDADAL